MANKIPLKIEAGELMQFQAGDTISSAIAPGSGGSPTVTSAVLSFTTASRRQVITVVDAAVSAASKLIICLGTALDTEENSDDTIDLLSLTVVPAAGSFQARLNFLTPIRGSLRVNYMVG